jgi:iron complex transport system ATP-binding protein
MRVRIFGRERWDLTQLRQHFGVVGTDMPGERTAVTTGLDAVIAGFFSASSLWPNLHVTAGMRERAREALDRMDALPLANQMVGAMSAGQKRRILIARALVHRPRQLLLDEPSNALDLAAQQRVILMRGGRIVGDGPREEFLTEPRLSELFNTPVRIGREEGWLHSW